MRRRLTVVSALCVLALLLAAPAALAATVALSQPSDTVTGATDLRVTITRDSRVEPIERARIRLQRDGGTVGDWVELACKQRCGDDRTEQIWGPEDDRRLDPATGAPFASDGPLRNGEYEVQIRVNRGRFLEPVEAIDRMRLAVPPSAPADVSAGRDGDEVTVSWGAAPEPDVTGYRVERRDGGSWKELATTSDDRHVDEPGPGSHTYRVVTLRDDGRGGTLETASSEREVEVPEPDADRDEGGSGGGDGDDASGSGNGSGDGAASQGEGGAEGDGDAGEAAPEAGSAGGAERSRRGSSDVARAPSLGAGRSGEIPGVFGRSPEAADPDAYSDELDFSGVDRDGDADDDVVLSARGGLRGTVDRFVDAERIATPIAVGLVMTATGLHLWRWLRVPGL